MRFARPPVLRFVCASQTPSAELSSSLDQPWLLLVISFVVPLVSVLLVSALVMRNAWDVHNSVLSVLMSYTMAGLVTQVIKVRGTLLLTSPLACPG